MATASLLPSSLGQEEREREKLRKALVGSKCGTTIKGALLREQVHVSKELLLEKRERFLGSRYGTVLPGELDDEVDLRGVMEEEGGKKGEDEGEESLLADAIWKQRMGRLRRAHGTPWGGNGAGVADVASVLGRIVLEEGEEEEERVEECGMAKLPRAVLRAESVGRQGHSEGARPSGKKAMLKTQSSCPERGEDGRDSTRMDCRLETGSESQRLYGPTAVGGRSFYEQRHHKQLKTGKIESGMPNERPLTRQGGFPRHAAVDVELREGRLSWSPSPTRPREQRRDAIRVCQQQALEKSPLWKKKMQITYQPAKCEEGSRGRVEGGKHSIVEMRSEILGSRNGSRFIEAEELRGGSNLDAPSLLGASHEVGMSCKLDQRGSTSMKERHRDGHGEKQWRARKVASVSMEREQF